MQLAPILARLVNVRQLLERTEACTRPKLASTLLQPREPSRHSPSDSTSAAAFSSSANLRRLPGVPMHVPCVEQNALLASRVSVICAWSPQKSSTSAVRAFCAAGLTAYARP